MINYDSYQISAFFNIMAFVLLSGLLILSKHLKANRPGERLMRIMCIAIMVDSVGLTAGIFSHLLTDSAVGVVKMLSFLIRETAVLCFVYAWLLFVDYMLYGSRDYLRRGFRIGVLPAVFVAVMFAVFAYRSYRTEESGIDIHVPYWVNVVLWMTELLYLLLTLYTIQNFRKKTGRYTSFRISPVITAVFIGIILTFITRYSVRTLGYAIALTNLYFSMMDVWRFENTDIPGYNSHYLERVREYAKLKKKDYGGIMMISRQGAPVSLTGIIWPAIPGKMETVTMDDGSCMLFMEGRNRQFAESLERLVRERLDEYADSHPDSDFKPDIRLELRKKNETPTEFIGRVTEPYV